MRNSKFLSNRITRYNSARHLFLLVTFILALFLRIRIIDQYGLSEDEILKVLAVREYLNYNFTLNIQHPALSKLFIMISVAIFGESEFALRFPNTVFAALTVYPLFYLTRELMTDPVGYISALVWAVDIPSIAFTTTAKEDSIFTFFFILSTYFVILGVNNPINFKYAGVAIGLTFASKYVAAILILHIPAILFLQYPDGDRFDRTVSALKIMIIYAIPTFLIANFPLLLPSTIRGFIDYYIFQNNFHPDRNGFIMMGRLFRTRPAYLFVLVLFVKQSIFTLSLFLFSLFLVGREKTKEQFILLVWIIIPFVIFTVAGVAIGAYIRYILVFQPAIIILASFALVRISSNIAEYIGDMRGVKLPRINYHYIYTGLLVIIVSHSIFSGLLVSPYYRMYVNEIGGGSDKMAYYFPQDEVYDYSIRESIRFLNNHASDGAGISMEVPIIGEYYGRSDLNFYYTVNMPENISLWKDMGIDFVIIQESRIYLQNQEMVQDIRRQFDPIKEYQVLNVTVVEIYAL